jgi:cytochrome c oxidase subunit 4
MSDSHDVSKQVRIYISVFVALLVGTVLTVGMYYVHFESVKVTVTIAMFIASVKAFLVAGYFMHLISERTTIYALLISTAFFFASLMGLTLFAMSDIPQYH